MRMPPSYQPPCKLTPAILGLVAEIAEETGRLSAVSATDGPPQLRRENRIRTIHSSLAIENNSLTFEQVTSVLEGKRVLGKAREIQEVRNAFSAYEAMASWQPSKLKDMLEAHRILMDGLTEDAGRFRSGSVGIAKGADIVHVAPPPDRVPGLITDLLGWLSRTRIHPLVASCIVHYEVEFIHPFSDGNGRIGRLWQTLILSQWCPFFAYLPVETIIRDRQSEYYGVLSACDKGGDSSRFAEFMLEALLATIRDVELTAPVSDQVTDQVKGLLRCLAQAPRSALECMRLQDISHRPTFRANYLNPALKEGLIERTIPDKPNSRLQKYRLTGKGRSLLDKLKTNRPQG